MHTRHRVNRNALRAHRLVTEVHDSDVVPDVSVRRKNTIEFVLVVRRSFLQCIKLLAHVWRGVEDVFSLRAVIDYRNRARRASQALVLPGTQAMRLVTACLRIAGVLGDAQNVNRHATLGARSTCCEQNQHGQPYA